MTDSIEDICEDAVSWLPTLGQMDADTTIATVIERVICVLGSIRACRGSRGIAWRLLFADVEGRAVASWAR